MPVAAAAHTSRRQIYGCACSTADNGKVQTPFLSYLSPPLPMARCLGCVLWAVARLRLGCLKATCRLRLEAASRLRWTASGLRLACVRAVRLRCVRAASGCFLAASGPLLGCSWAASGLCLDCGWTAAGLPILVAPTCQVFSRLLKAFCSFSWASPRLLLGCHGSFGSLLARPELLLSSSWLVLASAGPWFLWMLLAPTGLSL